MGFKIAVIGARGQLGSEVMRAAAAASVEAIPINREQCDVRDESAVRSAFEKIAPLDLVVNTAAFHRVDDCESRPGTATAVNVRGAYNVANAARAAGAATAFISSDFVFDGSKSAPYVESDEPAPLNVYGATKAAGEAVTRLANPKSYVLRIASVFGPAGSSGKGGNFVETMIAKARAGERPAVRDDLIMSPTSAADAAGLLVELLRRRAPPGAYHLSNAGQCSWREFADVIFELSGSPLRAEPARNADTPDRARRPRFSALASERLGELGLAARPWREALAEHLTLRGYRDAG